MILFHAILVRTLHIFGGIRCDGLITPSLLSVLRGLADVTRSGDTPTAQSSLKMGKPGQANVRLPPLYRRMIQVDASPGGRGGA